MTHRLLLLIALVFLGASLSFAAPKRARPLPTAASPLPAPLPPDAPGSVSGSVRYGGSSPLRIKELTNTVDVETCGAKVRSDQVLVGAQSTLANVVIELRRADGSLRAEERLLPPESPVIAELVRCSHQPHVMIVPLGAALEIRNSDRLHHEIETWTSRNPSLNEVLARYQRRIRIEPSAFEAPERVRVTCTRHPWMVGWWIVTDNLRVVVTDSAGRFTFASVPPGEWTLSAWHEQLGSIERGVRMEPAAALRIDLALE